MISTERREQIERMRLEDIARMEVNDAIEEDQKIHPTADDDMNWIRGERDKDLWRLTGHRVKMFQLELELHINHIDKN